VKGAIPRTSAQIFHDFRGIADRDSALTEIVSESLAYSKERLAFMQDRKRYISKLTGTTMLEMSLTASQLGVHEGQLSTSVIMSDSLIMNALSTSTLNFLTDGQFHINVNLRQFLEPVKTAQQAEAENRLKSRLRLYGLEARRDIPGDGNCQMYSLSHQLTDTIKHAKFIRRTVVAWLRRNGDLLLPNGALLRHFACDKEWDAYCNDMARDGVWGDHLTLIAAGEVFNARIVIVSSLPGDNFIVEINPIASQGEGSPAPHLLTLSHFAEFHYGSVNPIDPNNSPF